MSGGGASVGLYQRVAAVASAMWACTRGTTLRRPRRDAAATRLIEPDADVAGANTPGTVVARFAGGRPSTQRLAWDVRPVSTKPCSSRQTSVAATRSAARRPAAGTARTPRAGSDLAGVQVADDDPLEPAVAAAVDDLGARA